MTKCRFHAVAFDLDGTLLNTLDDLANATNEALASAGFPQHPLSAYRQFVGSGLQTLVSRALPSDIAQEKLDELVRRTGENYARDWAVHTLPYPGIPELLRDLCHWNVLLSVVTNKPHDWTVRMLDHFFPEKPFQVIQGAVPELPHKPDPAGALETARRLGVFPETIAFVGDSDIDMYTAHNAGMGAYGAAWGFRGATELREAGADKILFEPAAILDLFEPAR